jgi:hypothetical protein
MKSSCADCWRCFVICGDTADKHRFGRLLGEVTSVACPNCMEDEQRKSGRVQLQFEREYQMRSAG